MSSHDSPLTERVTSSPSGLRTWHQERVIFEVTERLCELMQEKGVSRSDLAERLGKTKGYISQILSGSANLTLRSMSDLYLALDREFHVDDEPLDIGRHDDPEIYNFEAYIDDDLWTAVPTTSLTVKIAKAL
jgi:transcriptional regulator with XRE-family HTH domain